MDRQPAPIDQLVEAVRSSPKYRYVAPDLIRHIGSQELPKRRNVKEAVKATKSKLHQIGGAYLDNRMRYDEWLARLRAVTAGTEAASPDALRRVCREIMHYHVSTRERLEILDEFYALILAELPPIDTVLDIACGLHPLSIPWMPLPRDVTYYACDIYQDMAAFLTAFMQCAGIRGKAYVQDVIHSVPARQAAVAFLLKCIPCLEQVDGEAGARLLNAVDAPHLVVSFPVHTIGGRRKGMPVNYEARFEALVAGKPWTIRRMEFATELVFVVSR